ncbi:fructose-bisphosphate aldolase [Anaeramoeba flamelloides]|uniref:fructose-bisphosphate aldolase n=1 Tax=Anaeramoeba flamelloides TaxID=1746091 RepID=A0AAV8A4E8_9EUKA|nr:fructose-bisphosphate aldolase [Anaeramoeba flamelloides]KAJ6243789.1 fructose-bisphosphate aldolase [Anaeramoeba flamelloides]
MSQFEEVLAETIKIMCTPGRGILAADESVGTIGKRFDLINVENVEENRRCYRDYLFSTPNFGKYISGVILYEEQVFQKTSEGVLFPEIIRQSGAVAGWKSDTGLRPLEGYDKDTVTQGLDNLAVRCQKVFKAGCRFTKFRSAFHINAKCPSSLSVSWNAMVQARQAKIAQENGLVPIVEPEVLVSTIEDPQDIEDAYRVTKWVLTETFRQLNLHKVDLRYMILKPNMVYTKKELKEKNYDLIAEKTFQLFTETLPTSLPAIFFLSGGQDEISSTINLDKINKLKNKTPKICPWYISFSYGRALQRSALEAWKGKTENKENLQKAFTKRALKNSQASIGEYVNEED